MWHLTLQTDLPSKSHNDTGEVNIIAAAGLSNQSQVTTCSTGFLNMGYKVELLKDNKTGFHSSTAKLGYLFTLHTPCGNDKKNCKKI